MTSVSAVVPCYRDAHLVERTLARLLRSEVIEIVLANNDSAQREELRQIVETLGDTRVRVLELADAIGFCAAVNRGIEATTGEMVLFANSDLFVTEGYVETLARFLEEHPRAACASGKILRWDLVHDRETDLIDTTGLVIHRSRRVVDRGENERDVGQFDREEEVFGVSGAAVVVRRRALESVMVDGEYLDESFGMYKEDVDLSWRFRLAGWECWYVPGGVAYHARTTRGLGGTRYLRGLRAFHENEKRKPRQVRINSMKNQWLLLVKNDSARDVASDLPYIAGREALVLAHNFVFSPRDAAVALKRFAEAAPVTVLKRRSAKTAKRSASSHVRRWSRHL